MNTVNIIRPTILIPSGKVKYRYLKLPMYKSHKLIPILIHNIINPYVQIGSLIDPDSNQSGLILYFVQN